MTLFTLFLGLISTASAGPTGHEVQLDSTSFSSEDSRWDVVGQSTVQLTGLSAGWRIAPKTNIIAGWRYGAMTNTTAYDDIELVESDDVVQEIESDGPRIGLKLHQISVGAKYSLDAKDWLQPYGAGVATLSLGQLTLDDEPDTEGNVNEFSRTALAPGATLALGIDLLPLGKDARARPTLFMELGYQLSLPLSFVDDTQKDEIDIGQLPIGNVLGRTGIGLRF